MENALTSQAVAIALEEIAYYRRLSGEQWAARAYEKTAKLIRDKHEIPNTQSEIRALPGIGEKLADVIWNLVTTGTDPTLESGRAKWPNLTELEQIRGVGSKKALSLFQHTGAKTLLELKKAIDEGRISVNEAFLKNLEFAMKATGRTPRYLALAHLQPLVDELKIIPGCFNCEFAGSLRRGKDTVGDVDILFAGTHEALEAARALYRKSVELIDADGETKMRGLKTCGKFQLQVDLLVVPEEEWGSALAYFTGSRSHNIQMRQKALDRNWKLNEHGLWNGTTRVAGKTEQSIYDALSVPFHPPELREFGILDSETIGRIVSRVDSDWHCHTTFSDGVDEPEALIQAAKLAGLRHFGVTDHYRPNENHSSKDFAEHKQRCKAAAKTVGIEVLVGLEVDIMPDGSLFGKDEVLDQCDYIIASVHISTDKNVVERLKKAAQHPKVKILGHPTTRVLGSRPAAEGDWAGLFELCAKNGVCLEINGGPNRLDLPEELITLAKSKGCRFVLVSDAHSASHLDWLNNSLRVARRAHLEVSEVLVSL